jgi:hypothetical protein
VGSLRDTIALIVDAYRAFASYPLVYCDTTASRRKVYVLTIKSSRIGAAVWMSENVCAE